MSRSATNIFFGGRKPGVWEHRSGSGGGLYVLNADGVDIMLQQVSFWPINSVGKDGRLIIIYGENPLGEIMKIGHIKFKKSQDVLFKKVVKIIGL